MAKGENEGRKAERERKPVAWLHGEIKTPPFTEEGRKEAGKLLRLLQEGERVGFGMDKTTGASCTEWTPTPF
jgi:hypothetical protein